MVWPLVLKKIIIFLFTNSSPNPVPFSSFYLIIILLFFIIIYYYFYYYLLLFILLFFIIFYYFLLLFIIIFIIFIKNNLNDNNDNNLNDNKLNINQNNNKNKNKIIIKNAKGVLRGILPEYLSEFATKKLREGGVHVHSNTKVTQITSEGDKIFIHLEGQSLPLSADFASPFFNFIF